MIETAEELIRQATNWLLLLGWVALIGAYINGTIGSSPYPLGWIALGCGVLGLLIETSREAYNQMKGE